MSVPAVEEAVDMMIEIRLDGSVKLVARCESLARLLRLGCLSDSESDRNSGLLTKRSGQSAIHWLLAKMVANVDLISGTNCGRQMQFFT